jgi:hypothetical protein
METIKSPVMPLPDEMSLRMDVKQLMALLIETKQYIDPRSELYGRIHYALHKVGKRWGL